MTLEEAPYPFYHLVESAGAEQELTAVLVEEALIEHSRTLSVKWVVEDSSLGLPVKVG